MSQHLACAVAARVHAAARTPDRDQLTVHLALNSIAAMGRENLSQTVRSVVYADTSPGARAFRLAAAMHARTQDDNYAAGRTHVGTLVLPAILACDARDVTAAMAGGYEATQCLSLAYSAPAQQLGLRPTPIFGAFGAAAAASLSLGHDLDRTTTAISLVAATVSGTNQAWLDGADDWLFQVASATRHGVEAALLAGHGAVGSHAAFEGASGLSRLYGDPSGDRLRHELDAPLTSPRDVENKPLPIGGVALAATLLAAQLGETTRRAMPTSLTVHLPRAKAAYPGALNNGPFRGRADSLMSVSRCVGLGYLCGNVPYAKTEGQPTRTEQDLLDRTVVVPDADLPDGAARISAAFGERVESVEGECLDLLYPDWNYITHNLRAVSERYEADHGSCAELCGRIAQNASGAELAEVIDSAKPDRELAGMETVS